jgi:mannonate dehydratase
VNTTRRDFLWGAAAASLLPGCLGRKQGLSRSARELVRASLADLGPGPVLDCHVHIVGLGRGGTGCWVHPRMTDAVSHPKDWARFQVYQAAAGVKDLSKADSSYVEVLTQRLDAMPVPVRALIFAFDQVYDDKGRAQPEISEFHTPDSHVLALARDRPQLVPVASVHPYRLDAVEALHSAAAQGAVAVKWLPNAQRMDPASALCDRAYRALQELGLPLITHAGHEQAVEAEAAQALGCPLRLRRALDAGVKVIVAHCASLGVYPDSDDPMRTVRPSLDLFLRLMDTKEYEGRIWGDISALTVFTRIDDALPRVLRRTDLHHRLIHGSDYPIPAIDPLINTWQILAADLIDSEDRAPLSELWDRNPFLFDLVLKRRLRAAEDPTIRFPPSVFQPPAGLFPRLGA